MQGEYRYGSVEEMESEIEVSRNRIERLEDNCKEWNMLVDGYVNENDKLKQENTDLKALITLHKENIKKLKETIKTQEMIIDDLWEK